MPRGRSAPSARSDSSEMDADAETEMDKLQRQFRVMEGDRQAYNIQAREQIRKQQQEMHKLLKEQEELQRNLVACKSFSRQQQDSEDMQSLCALREEEDIVDEAIEKERQCQKAIEKEIANMQLKLADLRKGEVGTSDPQRSEQRRTQKAIRTLEYKLDRALTRFNEQLTRNRHLREELQSLHIERVRFQQLQNRLEKELHDVHKNIGEIVNLSTAAYDARVEAQSKITMMREKAEKDLDQYNTEMKELERIIAHECSLKDFMTTKCSERSRQDDGHEMGHTQLSELKEQRRMDMGEESLDALEEVFKRIQAVTGEDNLDLLVTRFIQVEDRNFALFNFVNEQNNEAKGLSDQINQLEDSDEEKDVDVKLDESSDSLQSESGTDTEPQAEPRKQIQAEIEQFRVSSLQRENDHRSLLRDINEQQKKTESQAEDYENQASIISKVLDEIKTGVNSIFSKLECDRSVIEDTLGSSTGISENNIMSFLGLVEQKTNELLTIQAFLSSKNLEKDYNPKDLATFLLGQNPELLQQNISTQPAIKNVDYDAEESPVTDEEEQPLSQEELRKTIMKGILQKESSVQQATTKASKIGQQFDGRRRSLEEPLI